MFIFSQRVKAIYSKELLEIVRDRRTLTAMIVVPIALYPILMVVFANAAGEQSSQISRQPIVVGVKSDAERDRLIYWVREDLIALYREQGLPPPNSEIAVADLPDKPEGHLADSSVYVVPDGDLERAIREQLIQVGLEIQGGLVRTEGREQVPVKMYALAEYIRSRDAANRLYEMIDRINHRTRPNLIEVSEVSLTTPTSILSVILPLILILMTITGAIYPAIDMTAGERERGTLESLMVCPVPVRDLITGKFLVVTTIAIGGAALNLASVSATVYFGGFTDLIQQGHKEPPPIVAHAPADSDVPVVAPPAPEHAPSATDRSTQLPWYVLPIILVLLIPFAVLMSAIMLAVSAAARTFKEAQNYVTPVILAVLLPGGMASLPGTELSGSMLVMPVANMVLLTRDLLREPSVVPFTSIAWVLLSTSLYAVAAVAVATRVFGHEAVVFSDSGSFRTSLMRKFLKPREAPSRTMVWLFLALLLPIWFYVQSGLSKGSQENIAGLLVGTAILMPVCFVFVPVGLMLYFKIKVVKTLALAAPNPLHLLAGLLVGASAWVPVRELVLFMQERFGEPAALKMLDDLLQTGLQQMPPWAALLTVAIVPGLCEELLFRGVVLQSLRPTVKRIVAITITAFVFAAFHMSFYRFPVTFALGLMFGWLCWQSHSIWPSILAHMLHNAMGVSQVIWPGWQQQVYAPLGDESGHLPFEVRWLAIAALALAAGLTFVAARRRS